MVVGGYSPPVDVGGYFLRSTSVAAFLRCRLCIVADPHPEGKLCTMAETYQHTLDGVALEKMAETYQDLFRGASWLKVRVPFGKMHVYLKCRIIEHVKPQASVPEFAILDYASCIFPNGKRIPAGGHTPLGIQLFNPKAACAGYV